MLSEALSSRIEQESFLKSQLFLFVYNTSRSSHSALKKSDNLLVFSDLFEKKTEEYEILNWSMTKLGRNALANNMICCIRV